jgi:hypothetical protein
VKKKIVVTLFKIMIGLLVEGFIFAFKHLAYGLVFSSTLSFVFGQNFSILSGFSISVSMYLITKLIRNGWNE